MFKQNLTFWKKDPYGQIFKNVFQKDSWRHRSRFVCKFREIWLTGSRQSRAFFTWPKKNKISARSPALASAGSQPKCVRASSGQYTWSAPNFIRICTLPAELSPDAWTSLKRTTKCFQYSAKILCWVKIYKKAPVSSNMNMLLWQRTLAACCRRSKQAAADKASDWFIIRVRETSTVCRDGETTQQKVSARLQGASFQLSCSGSLLLLPLVWRSGATGGAMVQRVRHLGLRSVGCGFNSCWRQRCVTTLGKLFTPMCLCHQAV